MHKPNADFIISLATRVFGDSSRARDWLYRPRVQLGGRTPSEFLGTPEGLRRVEELLTQLDDDRRLGID